jgi:tRNA U34 5-methylaminomethyl-2-thiouridine-forming methyltransferase MnmC
VNRQSAIVNGVVYGGRSFSLGSLRVVEIFVSPQRREDARRFHALVPQQAGKAQGKSKKWSPEPHSFSFFSFCVPASPWLLSSEERKEGSQAPKNPKAALGLLALFLGL